MLVLVHRRGYRHATPKIFVDCVSWKWHVYADKDSCNKADGSEGDIPADLWFACAAKNCKRQPGDNRSCGGPDHYRRNKTNEQ